MSDYLQLTKPRLNLLVVFTTGVGYWLGVAGHVDPTTLFHAVVGTALVAGGSAVFNQLYEQDVDALMARTRLRPLPDGRLAPWRAFTFGLIVSALGLIQLSFGVNHLSAVVAFATLVTYVVWYTPMKRRSSLATVIGAIPGALPPVIGWAAATNTVSREAWLLFAIVFLWQERAHLDANVAQLIRLSAVGTNEIISELVRARLQTHVEKLVAVLAVGERGNFFNAEN